MWAGCRRGAWAGCVATGLAHPGLCPGARFCEGRRSCSFDPALRPLKAGCLAAPVSGLVVVLEQKFVPCGHSGLWL